MDVWQYGKRVARSALSPPPTPIATLAGQALFLEKSGIGNHPRNRGLIAVASPGNDDMHVDAPGASHMKETQGCSRRGRA